MRKKLTTAQRVGSFKAYVEDMKRSWYQIWDVDGEYRYWKDLSLEGKVEALVRAAADDDVPFVSLGETTRETFSGLPPGAVEQAALSIALRMDKELHAIAKVLPKWWDYDHEPPPLPEQVKELVDSYAKDARELEKIKSRKVSLSDLKVSLPDLKADGQQKQQQTAKARDRGMER
jgi:hypothetical protein